MLSSLARYRSPLQITLVAFSLSVIASGCGGGGAAKGKGATARVKASGKVTLDGTPIPFGTITFYSNATGNTGAAQIKNGEYSCSGNDGPNSGENGVVIVGKDKADGDPTWQYNGKATIPADGFKGDFNIKADETKKSGPRVVDE